MSDAQPKTKTSRRPQPHLTRMLNALAIAGCLPTVLALAGRWWWPLELMTHFRAYYVGLLLTVTLVLIFARRFKTAMGCGLCLSINVLLVAVLYFGGDQPDSAKTIRGLLANVHTGNRNHRRFIELVRDEDPDFLVVLEVNRRWMDALAELNDDFPYRLALPREDNFGIAFFSRLPAEFISPVTIGAAGVPSVLAKLTLDGRSFTVIGTHTLPPISRDYAAHRNKQIEALADVVRSTPAPLVVLGDLNMTSWSPFFGDLLKQTTLRDSRRGFGIQSTWTGFGGLMRLPLDHVLVTPDVNIHDRRVAADVGSDHFPVVIDLSFSDDESQ